MVRCCAEKFADNPAIVGYDMLNEPFGDEALQISPLYEDIAARIRKHDKKAILFVEPQVLIALFPTPHADFDACETS